MTKLESLQEDIHSALLRLEEVLQKEKTEIVRDSAIKRFEIAFDLAWKMMKAFLEERHNTTCGSPQGCLKEAFRLGLIEYEERWLWYVKMRNYGVHTYSEKLAEKIYTDLPEALAAFQKLFAALSEQK